MPCKATTKVEKFKLQKAKEACIKAKDIWNKNTCKCTVSSNHKKSLQEAYHKKPMAEKVTKAGIKSAMTKGLQEYIQELKSK